MDNSTVFSSIFTSIYQILAISRLDVSTLVKHAANVAVKLVSLKDTIHMLYFISTYHFNQLWLVIRNWLAIKESWRFSKEFAIKASSLSDNKTSRECSVLNARQHRSSGLFIINHPFTYIWQDKSSEVTCTRVQSSG